MMLSLHVFTFQKPFQVISFMVYRKFLRKHKHPSWLLNSAFSSERYFIGECFRCTLLNVCFTIQMKVIYKVANKQGEFSENSRNNGRNENLGIFLFPSF